MSWTYFKLKHNDNGLSELVFDYPKSSINKLSFEALEELKLVIDEIDKSSDIKVLTFSSAKKDFIVGADVKEIKGISNKEEIKSLLEQIHILFAKIEDLKCKSIAILDGFVLGGGLEIALCFDYRIASSNTTLGFPETKLGIIPGFGGTYRANKLLGLQQSLTMILTAKNVDSKKAYRTGLVDKIYSSEKIKKEFIDEVLANKIKTKTSKIPLIQKLTPSVIVIKKTRENILKKTKNQYPALISAIDVLAKIQNKDRDKAIEIETEYFCDVATSDISKNLIEIFLSSQELKTKYTSKAKLTIENTAVIGSGIMGSGIIWLINRNDFYIRVKLLAYKELENLHKNIKKLYAFYVKTRKLSLKDISFKMDRLSYSDKYDGLQKSDLVIEAIFEDINIKQESFEQIELNSSKSTIIASNTSSISINKLATTIKNKKNFLGIHFFNPVQRMPLVEIIPTKDTSKKSIEQAVLFVQKINKTPVIVKDCAGFLINRLLMSFLVEAIFLLEEGGSVEQIDKVLLKFGMPMGAFRLLDEVGIDIGYHVVNILAEDYGERMKAPKIIKEIFDAKLLGKKSKKGFYVYNGKEESYNQEIDKFLKNKDKSLSDKYIEERAVFALINEASKALEEEVVDKANILDFAFILGTGFPPFRGGVLRYADSLGLDYVVGKLKEFQGVNKQRFEVSKLLEDMAKDKKRFYDY